MSKVGSIVLAGAALAALVAFSCSTETKKKTTGETVTTTLPSPAPGVVITPGPESPAPAQCTAACSDSLKIAFTAGTPTGAKYWSDDESLDENGTQVNGNVLDVPLGKGTKAIELDVATPKLRVRLELEKLEKKPYAICGQTCNRYEVTLPDGARGWYYCDGYWGADAAKSAAEKAALCETEKARCAGGAVKSFDYATNDGGEPYTRVYWSCGG